MRGPNPGIKGENGQCIPRHRWRGTSTPPEASIPEVPRSRKFRLLFKWSKVTFGAPCTFCTILQPVPRPPLRRVGVQETHPPSPMYFAYSGHTSAVQYCSPAQVIPCNWLVYRQPTRLQKGATKGLAGVHGRYTTLPGQRCGRRTVRRGKRSAQRCATSNLEILFGSFTLLFYRLSSHIWCILRLILCENAKFFAA